MWFLSKLLLDTETSLRPLNLYQYIDLVFCLPFLIRDALAKIVDCFQQRTLHINTVCCLSLNSNYRSKMMKTNHFPTFRCVHRQYLLLMQRITGILFIKIHLVKYKCLTCDISEVKLLQLTT